MLHEHDFYRMMARSERDEILRCLLIVEEPIARIIGDIGLEVEMDFLFVRILSCLSFVERTLERIRDGEIRLCTRMELLWSFFGLCLFECIDDTSENLSGSRRSCYAFHILPALVSGPHTYHVMVREPDRPIIPEVPRCTSLDRYIPVSEIERGIEGKVPDFRIPVREYRHDHISVFLVYLLYTGSCSCIKNLKWAVPTLIREYAIRFE